MKNAQMNFSGIIFDLDGTLIDSMSAWENIGSSFLKKHGIDPREDLNKVIKTMSFAESARYLSRFTG
jgi:Predicted phosphatase/phosphohexomutase